MSKVFPHIPDKVYAIYRRAHLEGPEFDGDETKRVMLYEIYSTKKAALENLRHLKWGHSSPKARAPGATPDWILVTYDKARRP